MIKNGALLTTPFLTVNVNAVGERGLLGVAFDPNFAFNQFVYVYYTTASAPIHNRVSRFTAMGDVAAAGSEVVILELENLSSATNHNGGALHFGPDGTLYVAVGDNANGANAQTLGNRLGKILRFTRTEPFRRSNPFFNTATGANRAIWALGLRNPFTFAFQPGTGRMFINDVGQNTWEEINDGIAGSNYGWPDTEGADDRSPLPGSDLLLRPRGELDDGLRHQRRRLLQPGDPALPERLHRRLLLRRLLQRLDPKARSGEREHGDGLRDRHRQPGRPGGRERRQPLLPRARLRRGRVPRRLHGKPGTQHHDPSREPDGFRRRVGHVQRRRQRHAAAVVSVAAERRRHPRRHSPRATPSRP